MIYVIAIYARQSVDKKDSISIESQVDFCKKEICDEEYKVYTDKGFSGGNTNRPAFESMLDDIERGIIKKVIVYKLDRISRSILDFANIIKVFKSHNVEFQSSTEKFDTSTPIGNAMLNITMVFAQLERETIQKRIKDNYYARGRKGFYMGGRAPYGFTKVETRVEGIKTSTFKNNPEQMPYLLEMYRMYSETDMSLGKISDFLNNKKVPSAEGGLWDSCKISRILRSPVYVKADADVYLYYKNKGCIINNDISQFIGKKGCYLYGKREANERKYTKVTDHVLSLGLHEGVVDSRTWLLCQYKLDHNKQVKNSGKGKHSWLSGYVKCGYCNYAVSVVRSGEYKYFNCRGKTNYKICNGHSSPVHVDRIERIIEEFIFKKSRELKDVSIKIEDNENQEINKLKLQIIEIENQIEHILNQLTEANNVVMRYINERVTYLDNIRNSLIEEMRKLTVMEGVLQPFVNVSEYIDKWKECGIDEKKSICGFFINRIMIKDDEIVIDWKL